MINQAREEFTAMLDEKVATLKALEREAALKREAIDVTQPAAMPEAGCVHPMTLVLNEVVDCFTGMGFEVVEGPEVELDHFNFELMNIPKNHPARDAQDTFYVDDNIVLRTHTSPVQARTMLTRKPPIRVICPGRVYRADEMDATHSPVFHQLEGLVIDKDVTMADLRGTLNAFAQRLYGKGITTRFRPSFFPFTEPSAEVDLTCVNCHGEGCRVCKGTGWIEVLGCGMVNPKVLEMCGIDPTSTLALPSASAWSASPCFATASRICGSSSKATCASWASSGDGGGAPRPTPSGGTSSRPPFMGGGIVWSPSRGHGA